jgi:hypothetical protein
MNDFTKEELEIIIGGLYHANIADWDIGKKIKSMIDDYREQNKENKTMLNDKHIIQHAIYLIENHPNRQKLEKIMTDELWEVIVDIYKLGFNHGIDEERAIG